MSNDINKEDLELDYIFVLVHGTFARDAGWTHPGSKMSVMLKNAIPGDALVTTFEWSGRNSHGARLFAGAELAQRLRLLRSLHPGASLHVVAHSHGGNVVAYALREAGVRDLLDGVVFLGTPFIIAIPRSLKPTLRLLKTVSIVLSALGLLVLAFLALAVTTLVVYETTVSMILSGALFIIIGGVVCLPAARLGLRLGRYLDNKVAPRLKSMQDEIISLLQVTFADVPVLNIQTRGDEAAGYLRFIDWIAKLPFRIWFPTAITWVIGVMTVVFVTLYIHLMLQSEDWRQAPFEAIGGFVFAVIGYLAAVTVFLFFFTMIAQLLCILWAKVFRGHALGFGEEGFLKNWLTAISASGEPHGARRALNEVVEVTGSGLHHSLLYEDNTVLRSIANWLREYAERIISAK